MIALPRARGRALDRLAYDRLNMQRQGWERVWFIGDYFFRKRISAALRRFARPELVK